jgi:hypothetical protein
MGDGSDQSAARHAAQRFHAARIFRAERAAAAGIEVLALSPRRGDFNDDLQAFGLRELRAALRSQLAPQDAARYIPEAAATAG